MTVMSCLWCEKLFPRMDEFRHRTERANGTSKAGVLAERGVPDIVADIAAGFQRKEPGRSGRDLVCKH
jgi:hypothetical protein